MKDELKDTLSLVLTPEEVEKAMSIHESIYNNDKINTFIDAISSICDSQLMESVIGNHIAIFEGWGKEFVKNAKNVGNEAMNTIRQNGHPHDEPPRSDPNFYAQNTNPETNRRVEPGKTDAVITKSNWAKNYTGEVPAGGVNAEVRHYGAHNIGQGENVVHMYSTQQAPRKTTPIDVGQQNYNSNPPPPPPPPQEKQTIYIHDAPAPKIVRNNQPVQKKEEKVVEETPIKTKTTNSSQHKHQDGACSIEYPYVIHVVSKNSETQAKAEVAKLNNMGIDAYIVHADFPINSRRKNVYRVRIGDFATRKDAIDFASKNLTGYHRFDPCKRTGWWIDKCENDGGITEKQWNATQKKLDEIDAHGGSCPVPDQPASKKQEANLCSEPNPATSGNGTQPASTGAPSTQTAEQKASEVAVEKGNLISTAKASEPNDDKKSANFDTENDALSQSLEKAQKDADDAEKKSMISQKGRDRQFNNYLKGIFNNKDWKSYISGDNTGDNNLNFDKSLWLIKDDDNKNIVTFKKLGITAIHHYINTIQLREALKQEFKGYGGIVEELMDAWGPSQIDFYHIIKGMKDELGDICHFGELIFKGEGHSSIPGLIDDTTEDFQESILEFNDEIDNIYETIEDALDGSEWGTTGDIKKFKAQHKDDLPTDSDAFVKHYTDWIKDKFHIEKITGINGEELNDDISNVNVDSINLDDDDNVKMLQAMLSSTEILAYQTLSTDTQREIIENIKESKYDDAKKTLYTEYKKIIAESNKVIEENKHAIDEFCNESGLLSTKLKTAYSNINKSQDAQQTLANAMKTCYENTLHDSQNNVTAENAEKLKSALDRMKDISNEAVSKANENQFKIHIALPLFANFVIQLKQYKEVKAGLGVKNPQKADDVPKDKKDDKQSDDKQKLDNKSF